ncbi:MAG: formylglycine-generating enzyme family protein [Bacteroidaceae bacterium]|nr:formylglycine-generating enzyme family protein [Bacteroidaceae bacterium]
MNFKKTFSLLLFLIGVVPLTLAAASLAWSPVWAESRAAAFGCSGFYLAPDGTLRGGLNGLVRINADGSLTLGARPIDAPTKANSLPAFDVDEVVGGTFQMGAWGKTLDGAWDDEKPAHQVTVSTFWMGRFEVTQALWQAVMGNNPSRWKGDNLPVGSVSWNDCQTFLQRLNNRKGELGLQGSMYFDLPTEAEWEFAARGGRNSGNYKYSGSDNLDYVAWHDGNSGSRTHPVGQKAKNELGLYDMTGNVWEWCKDWFGSYPSYAQTNPTGPSSASNRVLRGGSWYDFALNSRVSFRYSGTPDDRSNRLGLRLVLKFP